MSEYTLLIITSSSSGQFDYERMNYFHEFSFRIYILSRKGSQTLGRFLLKMRITLPWTSIFEIIYSGINVSTSAVRTLFILIRLNAQLKIILAVSRNLIIDVNRITCYNYFFRSRICDTRVIHFKHDDTSQNSFTSISQCQASHDTFQNSLSW